MTDNQLPQHLLAVDVVALSVLDGGLAAMLVRRSAPPSQGALEKVQHVGLIINYEQARFCILGHC
jgi:hypothetical protein